MSDTAPSLHRIDSDPIINGTTESWRTLIGQIGAEIAGPLSAAMERIHILTGTGRIDRKGLRALRTEVEEARQAGLIMQQIARLASGETTQSPEHLHLAPILRGVLAQRSRDIEMRGTQIRQFFSPVEVIADAPLLFSLLNALLDWALANASSPIEMRADIRSWPAHPRLFVHFAHALLERNAPPQPASGLDSLLWRLIEHTAAAMGLQVVRHVSGTHVELSIEFANKTEVDPASPETAAAPEKEEARQATPAPPPTATMPPAAVLKPLIGSHVLVASEYLETRRHVRDAIKNMGMIVDFVGSMEEAADFCRDGLPHALVFDAALRGPIYDELRSELLVEAPDLLFIEIRRESTGAEAGTGETTLRVDDSMIASHLPMLLATELTRSLQR